METQVKKKFSVGPKVAAALLAGALLLPTMSAPISAFAAEGDGTTTMGIGGDTSYGDKVDPSSIGSDTGSGGDVGNPVDNGGVGSDSQYTPPETGNVPDGLAGVGNGNDETKVTIPLSKPDSQALSSAISDLKDANAFTIERKPNKTSQGTKLVEQDGDNVIFHKDAFEAATDKTKKQALTNFVTMLQGSAVADQTQQQIIDKMQASDGDVQKMLIPMMINTASGDVYGAMKVLKPFIPIVRLAFGIGAVFLIFLLIGSTILDLAFIGFPVAREKIQGDGDKKGFLIKGVTTDAKSVIMETESDTSNGYTNPYWLYFKRRFLTYVLLSICILYLVVGEIGGLIDWFLTLGSGLVQGN